MTTAGEPGTPLDLQVGDLYEDCAYEPLLCVRVDAQSDEVVGISLINGRVGSCSLNHCGVRRLTLAEAVEIRGTWPPAHIVEFARENGQRLVLSGRTVAGAEARPGEAGLDGQELCELLASLARPLDA